MLFYSDPFKDNPYGRLQGEMSSVWCTFEFSEAKLYHHEDSYVLAANFTKLENVVRSYKPEQAIDLPVKAVWTIHSKDYQVRKRMIRVSMRTKLTKLLFMKSYSINTLPITLASG